MDHYGEHLGCLRHSHHPRLFDDRQHNGVQRRPSLGETPNYRSRTGVNTMKTIGWYVTLSAFLKPRIFEL